MTKIALLLGLCVALAGCSLSPSADVIKALAGDPATAQFSVVYPYGTINWCRTNPSPGAKVSCSNSGISIDTNTSTGIGVPLMIVPEIGVGQPRLMQPPR